MNTLALRVAMTLLAAGFASSTSAQWYGSADYLLMKRYAGQNPVFHRQIVQSVNRTVDFETTITVSANETITTETPIRIEEITDQLASGGVLSANDIDFGHTPAFRFKAGRQFGDFGIEGSWLWVESLAGSVSASSVGGNMAGPFVSEGALLSRRTYIEHVPTSTVLVDQIDFTPGEQFAGLFASFGQIQQWSKFQTGDFGVTAKLTENTISSITLLTGLRYAELDEQFGYSSISAAPPMGVVAVVNSPSQSIRTRNQLVGPQIGMAIDAGLRDRLVVNLSAKTTLAYNDITRDLYWSPDATNGGANVFTSVRDSTASFLGEFSLRGTLYLTRTFSVNLGYEMIVLSDIAVAADNFDRNIDSLNQGSSPLNANSRVAFGSPVFGATLTF